MLTGIGATEGKSSYGNPGEGVVRRSAEGQGRREWRWLWTKGVELGVGVGGEEKEKNAGSEAAMEAFWEKEKDTVSPQLFPHNSLRLKLPNIKAHPLPCLPPSLPWE